VDLEEMGLRVGGGWDWLRNMSVGKTVTNNVEFSSSATRKLFKQ
jgi:hypothetical protein